MDNFENYKFEAKNQKFINDPNLTKSFVKNFNGYISDL